MANVVFEFLEDVHIFWIVLIVALLAFFGYYKISKVVSDRQVFSENRVKKLQSEKRKAWEKKQMEIDPDVKEETNLPTPNQKKFDMPKDPKKKFNKMFGMGNIAARSCNTGS